MGLLPGLKAAQENEQQYRRGEIFYVNNNSKEHVGSETKKDRPAVIVSCDANNKHSSVLEMVFLTTQPKADLPTHVTIRSTGRVSTALCEAPTPVAVERLKNYLGKATEAEMKNIDMALLIGLGISYDKEMQKTLEAILEGKSASGGVNRQELQEERKEERQQAAQEGHTQLQDGELDKLREDAKKWQNEAIRADAESATYKRMYDDLLKIVIERR